MRVLASFVARRGAGELGRHFARAMHSLQTRLWFPLESVIGSGKSGMRSSKKWQEFQILPNTGLPMTKTRETSL